MRITEFLLKNRYKKYIHIKVLSFHIWRKILNLRIVDYIRYGGFRNIKNNIALSYDLMKNSADEVWGNNGSSILTYNSNYWSVEFLFLDRNELVTDQIELYPESIYNSSSLLVEETEVNYSENFVTLFEKNMISECYSVHDELIIFLANGTNVHFNKSNNISDFVIRKIIPKHELTKQNRKLISEIMDTFYLSRGVYDENKKKAWQPARKT